MRRPRLPSGWELFYRMVRKIPRGAVCTYGAIAEHCGRPRHARQVGYALAALHGAEHDVPWHRVLGARNRRSAQVTIKDPTGAAIQRQRLEAEGVRFDAPGRVSLEEFGWAGPRRRRAAAATGRGG